MLENRLSGNTKIQKPGFVTLANFHGVILPPWPILSTHSSDELILPYLGTEVSVQDHMEPTTLTTVLNNCFALTHSTFLFSQL